MSFSASDVSFQEMPEKPLFLLAKSDIKDHGGTEYEPKFSYASVNYDVRLQNKQCPDESNVQKKLNANLLFLLLNAKDLVKVWIFYVLIAYSFSACSGFKHFPSRIYGRKSADLGLNKFPLTISDGTVTTEVYQKHYREYLSALKTNSILKYKDEEDVVVRDTELSSHSRYLRNVTIPNLQKETESLRNRNILLEEATKYKDIFKRVEAQHNDRLYDYYLAAIWDLNDRKLSNQLKNTTLVKFFGRRRDGRSGLEHFIYLEFDSDALIAYKLHSLATKLAVLHPSIQQLFDTRRPGLVEAAIAFLVSMVPKCCVGEVTEEEQEEVDSWWRD